MSILITGATGFFGQGFIRTVLERNLSKRVCIYSRDEYKQSLMREAFKNDDRLRWFVGDVRDRDRLRRAMEGVTLVIHAAALKRVEVGEYNPTEMVRTNVMGAMNVIEAATDACVAKVVALSTDKACEPVNTYGASKLMAEKLFLSANNMGRTRFAVTRYGNVAGSTGSVIPTWREAVRAGRIIRMTNPLCTRYWMTLQQAVELVLDTADGMVGGELVVPTLPAYRLGDLATLMGGPIEVTGLGRGEKLHESMRTGESSEMARRMSMDELGKALCNV